MNSAKCSECKETKPISEFRRDRTQLSGLCSRCGSCDKKFKDAQRETKREYDRQRRIQKHESLRAYDIDKYRANPDKFWARTLQYKYGITRVEYDEILAQQDAKCAICGLPSQSKRFHHLGVDHDHKTGRIRGLLCGHCNKAIGLFLDNPDLCRRASDYLVQ